MKFYFFAFLYLFVFFGSIYGLFVDELNVGFGADSRFNVALSGWTKNVVCVFGLLLVAAIAAYPFVNGIYKALKNGSDEL